MRNAVVQSLSRVLLFATPWTAARQASLSITNSLSLLKLMSVDSVMPSKHLILCHPLLPPSIFPSIRVFSNELALKESLGLEKKTTVSKALAESSNFGENKTELMLQPDAPGWLKLPGTYHPLPRGLITTCPKPPTPCSTTNAISTKDYPKRPT